MGRRGTRKRKTKTGTARMTKRRPKRKIKRRTRKIGRTAHLMQVTRGKGEETKIKGEKIRRKIEAAIEVDRRTIKRSGKRRTTTHLAVAPMTRNAKTRRRTIKRERQRQ